jgi:hypothetical protein
LSCSYIRFNFSIEKDKNMAKDTKSTAFYMRASQTEKMRIALLAKRLQVKESEAVRRAVAHMLEATETRRHPSPTMQATAN